MDNKTLNIFTNDQSLLKDTGCNFTILDRLIGHGSYGDVYLGVDENGKQVAVKCCDLDSDGIPNILETSIMSSLVHPCLNNALNIKATDKKLYIIQPLAKTDLARYTRKDKGNYKPSSDELRRWCFSICQAVAVLHSENIIHADIKASNVLLFYDGSIKLTDFTLAVKKTEPQQKFTYNICTCTHRPLECLLKEPWDESVDIWSLGCTFYEIAYGELLFPYQGALEQNTSKGAKTRFRKRFINAIIDWSLRGPNKLKEKVDLELFSVNFIPFEFCAEYYRPEMELFNDMIHQMLMVEPSRRPNISQVLLHPYFNGLKTTSYISIRRPLNKIKIPEYTRILKYIEKFTQDKSIQDLAIKIYCSCNNLENFDENLRILTCVWISHKVIMRNAMEENTLKQSYSLNQILLMEREICHNLCFRIHSL